MHPTPRHARSFALLVTAAILVGSQAVVVGAEPIGGAPAEDAPVEVPSTESEQPSEPARDFPTVPGVDLADLGYEGEPIDGAVIERMAEPLPTDPSERVVELVRRMEIAPPQLESLVDAEALLRRALASREQALEDARNGVRVHAARAEQAVERRDGARSRLADRTTAIARHRERMAEVAVAAYVHPPDADVLAAVMGGVATTTEDLAAGVLFEAKADHDGEVRDSMEVAIAIAAEQVGGAESHAATTAEAVRQAEAALVDAEAREVTMQAAHDEVAEARELLEAQVPTLRPELDRTIQEAWGAFQIPEGEGGAIVVVEGIRVHASIAGPVQALLAVAHADGVPLSGWGFRSHEQQIALRQAHCGPTPEDVYLKPAEACSPPTARPGASMHERGLAIDFHLAGRSIATRESPGYQWLAANAARFGLHNLPSEPWHWSVNGQ